MPCSQHAETRIVKVPYSEFGMHTGFAGRSMVAREEDCYINWRFAPFAERHGVFLVDRENGVPIYHAAGKGEVGWDNPQACPVGDTDLLCTVFAIAEEVADGEAVDAYNLLSHTLKGYLGKA